LVLLSFFFGDCTDGIFGTVGCGGILMPLVNLVPEGFDFLNRDLKPISTISLN
jgi:hypothetical protein